MANKYGYNDYKDFPNLAYNAIKLLIAENQTIWKLLAYNDYMAFQKPDLTHAEKAALIYNGNEDETKFRVFQDIGQPDVWTHEACVLRISPYSIYPDNHIVGTIGVMFEIYCHYKINHLGNYTTRIDTVAQQLIEVFNGAEIGGIGRLFFDRRASADCRLLPAGQSPYRGKWLVMSNKAA